MILLSDQHWSPAAIAELLGCDPVTVRRWVHRYNSHGTAGLYDRPRAGRPRLGSPQLHARIRRLLIQPMAWTIPRLWQRLGRPAMSLPTLHRRVHEVACWRRPRLVAKGDPDRDQVLADLHRQLNQRPTARVVLAEDGTHINLLPWVRSTWIATGCRQQVMTPGTKSPRSVSRAPTASLREAAPPLTVGSTGADGASTVRASWAASTPGAAAPDPLLLEHGQDLDVPDVPRRGPQDCCGVGAVTPEPVEAL